MALLCDLSDTCLTCSEVVLRLLAGDMYSGRLIGKEGRHIRKVRELSNAKINIVLLVLIAVVLC